MAHSDTTMDREKDFQSAVLAAQERYAIDLKLPEPKNSGDTSLNLAETVASLALRGNLVSARRMIQESIQAREPEGIRLQCILAMMSNDWAAAWKSMEAYLRETKEAIYPKDLGKLTLDSHKALDGRGIVHPRLKFYQNAINTLILVVV